MRLPKVSVIVPLFNAGEHLPKCIQSLIEQSLREIEIILINDGSTDESRSIIEHYASIDSRIIFVNEVNRGVSEARNHGIRISTGEYIAFLDADDWVERSMMEIMYNKAIANEAQLVICNVTVHEDQKISERLQLKNEKISFQNYRQDTLVNLMRFKYDFSNWNKLYASYIVKQHDISFDSGMKVYEDLLFNLYFFQFTTIIVTVADRLYHYRVHENSVLNSKRYDIIDQYNTLFKNYNSFCKKNAIMNGVEEVNAEMRRGFYFTILPALVSQQCSLPHGMNKKIRSVRDMLIRVIPGLFEYKKVELKGVQGFKKRLLLNRRFYFFSIVSVLKKNVVKL